MTTNARFMYDDFGAACTMTASTAAASFPASNAVVDFRQVPWRSTAVTASWLQFTATSSISPTGIVIVDHNITSGNTQLRLRSSTTSNFSGGTQTVVGPSQMTWRSGLIYAFFSAPTARQYWRLEITDASNPAGYFQIGRVLLGTVFEPARAYRMGWNRTARDLSVKMESRNGVRTEIVKPQLTGMEMEFRIPTAADLVNWKAFRAKVQTARRFAFIPQGTNLDGSNSGSGPLDDALWGSFAREVSLPSVFNANSRAICAVEECA